jgi:hypothetical protein
MKPKKPAAMPAMPKSTAKDMRDKFWASDSTNLANAASTLIKAAKESKNPSYLETPTKSQRKSSPINATTDITAAKDSINAISKRRANDKEFWNKMMK